MELESRWRVAAIVWCVTLSACGPNTGLRGNPDRTPATGNDRWRLMSAAVDAALGEAAVTGTVCLASLEAPGALQIADSLLATLAYEDVVSLEECPRTYASMFRRVDPAGNPVETRPPGYIDPHRLLVGLPQFDGRRHVWIEIRLSQGTGGDRYTCSVFTSGEDTQAFCRITSSWVH